MGLIEDLGRGPVALDTAVLIKFIEQREPWLSAIGPMFAVLAAGALVAVTSTLTLMGVLGIPFRAPDLPLAAR